MSGPHKYALSVEWTGNGGAGTSDYKSYTRDYVIRAPGKPTIAGTADPAFRGDTAAYNPEDMLVASLSACHMLWYLHLCADAGICVTDYRDAATGVMGEAADGKIRFQTVTLNPQIVIAAGDEGGETQEVRALALHNDAHASCFIANSVNFPIACNPAIRIAGGRG